MPGRRDRDSNEAANKQRTMHVGATRRLLPLQTGRNLWHYSHSPQLSNNSAMTIQLSQKVNRIKPSMTLAVSSRTIELKAKGEDVIDLGVGEPDFDTPEFIKAAAIQALHEGFTKYTAVDGTTGLKKAIIGKLARENQLHYEPSQILVSCGAKHSLYNLFAAILNPGDEAIIPVPYWVSYPDMVLLTDGEPVFIPTTIEQHFKISGAQLEAAITPKTRLLILNSPSNPSGMVYTRQELSALAEVLLRHPNIIIASDDIYEHILWGKEPFANIVNVCPELYDRTVVINGVSKAYAMTGWRIGYAAGHATIINAMKKIQSQSTSNANSIAQVAAETALNGDQSFIKEMCTEFKRRHDFVVAAVNAIPGLQCVATDGAFYLFIHVEALLGGNVRTDLELTDYLLNTAKVSVVPGTGFGAPGYIRIAYATSMEILETALQRIKEAVLKLRQDVVV